MAPEEAPPPHFPQQPTATQLLLLIQPQTCPWTMAAHQHRTQPHNAAWKSCWTRHSSRRRYRSLAQLTQDPPPCCSLQTQLNAQSQLQHPNGPQRLGISSLWWTQPGQSSVAAEKSTSKSQEVLHRSCHNPLGLQLPAGECWALPPDQLSPDTRMAEPSLDLEEWAPVGYPAAGLSCLFLWHTLSAQRWSSCLDPNTGKVKGVVKHPPQLTPGTLLRTHLLPTTPTGVPETPHFSA